MLFKERKSDCFLIAFHVEKSLKNIERHGMPKEDKKISFEAKSWSG